MTIVVLWTLSGVIGVGVSIYNVLDARKDLAALEETDRDGMARSAARFLQNTEVVRLGQLVLIAAIGLLVLFKPLPSPPPQVGFWLRFESGLIKWAIVIVAWAMTGNSVQSFFYRRKLRR